MTTTSATEEGPVTVLSAGQALAVVLSLSEFEKLTSRSHGAKAGFAKHLFRGVDINEMLNTPIDCWETEEALV